MTTFQTADGSGGLLQAVPATACSQKPALHFTLRYGTARRRGIKHHSGRRVPALASLTTAAHRSVDWSASSQQPALLYSSTSSPQQQQVPACQGAVQQLQQCQVQAATLQIQQLHKQQHPQQTEHPHQAQQPSKQRTVQPSGPVKSCQDGLAALLASLNQAKLLVAGAMSAVVSRTAMAPLERVKMDLLLKTSSRSALQTAAWVYEREGVAGFWKGNGLNLLRTAPFKALNFFSFDVYSRLLGGMMADGSNSARFLAGAMAGITATLVCFPLDVLRTRLMAPWGHKYGGPLRTLAGMAKCEGLGALYAGCIPAVIGMAPSGAVFYGVYDLLKHRHIQALKTESLATAAAAGAVASIHQQHIDLPVLYTLLYGAVAGAASETILYPLEVVRRKMQLQSMVAGAAVVASNTAANAVRHHGLKAAAGALSPAGAVAVAAPSAAFARVAAACTAIIQADGVAGFYAGLLPNMLQVLPSAALSYGTYETVRHLLGVAG